MAACTITIAAFGDSKKQHGAPLPASNYGPHSGPYGWGPYFKIISFTVIPPGIIGRTCSWYGTATSRMKGPS